MHPGRRNPPDMNLATVFENLLRFFSKEGLDFALIGAFATQGLRVCPRHAGYRLRL